MSGPPLKAYEFNRTDIDRSEKTKKDGNEMTEWILMRNMTGGTREKTGRIERTGIEFNSVT